MRTAIYARVSTTDQDCGVQLAELRQYAAARGWSVAGEYVDKGWSGAKASRPALDRLMKDALARKVDTIIVYKIDRWGRSVQNMVNSLQELRNAGIRFIAVSQGFDTDSGNPTATLLFHILSAVAEFERELIKERVLAGVRKAQVSGTKSGKPIGRPALILDRQAVRDCRRQGITISEIQKRFSLSRGSVQRVLAGDSGSVRTPDIA